MCRSLILLRLSALSKALTSASLVFLFLLLLPPKILGQTPSLFQDLNTRPKSTAGISMAASSSHLFFPGFDLDSGRELWISDGSGAGTTLLLDIFPGTNSSNPGQFVTVTIGGSEITFFTATNADLGLELWRTDGTAAGTFPLDLNPGEAGSAPLTLTPYTEGILFSATTAGQGRELWFSGGTLATSFQIYDIAAGAADGLDGNAEIAVVPGTNRAVFAANDGISGQELWRTDGSAGTTQLVGNLGVGSSNSSPNNFLVMPALGKIFFRAYEFTNGPSLYWTDGISIILLRSFESLPNFSGPSDLAKLTDTTFVFSSSTLATGREPWFSDGTTAGTRLIVDFTPGVEPTFSEPGSDRRLVPVGGRALFVDSLPFANPAPGIHVTDGTSVGTKTISDATTFLLTKFALTASLGNRVFFQATTTDAGAELFSSDGTAVGTRLEADLHPGFLSGKPVAFTVFANQVYYFSETATGSGLFRTSATGVTTLVKDLSLTGTQSSSPGLVKRFTQNVSGAKMYFSATHGDFGFEPFVSDGTPQGTTLLKDVAVGGLSSFATAYIPFENDSVFFTANTPSAGSELWRSDGTEQGTILLKDIRPGAESGILTNELEGFVVGGKLLFAAHDGVRGEELWSSDFTPAGTNLLKDINLGAGSGVNDNANVNQFATLGDVLYFAGNDSGSPNQFNIELWRSDGTSSGTFKLKEIDPNTGRSGAPRDFAAVNSLNLMFFVAQEMNSGSELWKTDGTEGGSVMVRDINPGNGGSNPRFPRALDSVLLFAANGPGMLGEELWISDGSEAGTQLLRDINPGSPSSQINPRAVVGGRMYFDANDGVHGREPWVSDGTIAGTFLLKDLSPGTASTSISSVLEIDSRLFATAFVQEPTGFRRALYEIDLTTPDMTEVPLGLAFSSSIADFRGRIFLGLEDPTLGAELFSIVVDECPDDPAKSEVGVCGCGVADIDSNVNGIMDCIEDFCPADPDKTAPGLCGCGVPDSDNDSNGVPDCNDDFCPGDPNKVEAGVCGCGIADEDVNSNGVFDCLANPELAALLAQHRSLLKVLKLPKSGKKSKKIRALLKSIRASMNEIVGFANSSLGSLVIAEGIQFDRLLSRFRSSTRKSTRLNRMSFRSDKKKALRAVTQLEKSI